MKVNVLVLAMLIGSTSIIAQAPKLGSKLDKLNSKISEKAGSSSSTAVPKGIEAYSTEHSDKTGISGKYHMLYPVYLESKGKGFEMGEVTIEYRPDSYNGVFHWINDEVGKGLRYLDVNMDQVADMVPCANGKIGLKVIDKFGNFSFNIKNSNQFKSGTKKNQSFMDGAKIMRYSKDPEIIIVSSARVFESQGCVPVYKEDGNYFVTKMDTRYSFGQQYNVLSKDPEKLKDWDSTKLMQVAIELATQTCTDVQSAMADVFELPKRSHNDAALEKELTDRVKVMAANDKPIAWGDKFKFLYLHKDWSVVYEDYQKTKPMYRTCIAVAVSCGWDQGECRYIAVHVKQNWTGSDYGAKEVGFGGSLIPVSQEKVSSFK